MTSMTVHVALLRAVTVGSTSRLSMRDLRRECLRAGFDRVATYIQSGNVILTSRASAAQVKRRLRSTLSEMLERPVDIFLRTPAELEAVIERNPFASVPPERLLVLFLDEDVPAGALDDLVIPGREEVAASGREIFVHYPDGMGRSTLTLPWARIGTGRNLKTVRRLAALGREAAALPPSGRAPVATARGSRRRDGAPT